MECFNLQKVPVRDVNAAGRWSLHLDLKQDFEEDFVESLHRFGIIRPPLLQQQDNGSYEVICGVRRFRAAAEILKQSAVNCMVLDSRLAVTDLLLLVLEDQKLSGPLSPVEKARCLLLCRQMLADDSDLRPIAAALGDGVNRDRLLALLDLEEPIRADIHRGAMSEQAAHELLSLEDAERQALHRLFRTLSLNRNKQRRVIEMSRTAAVQQQCSIAEFLLSHYPEYLCGTSPVSNIPQATHHLLQDLNNQSAPRLSKAEKAFSENVAALDLPPSCTVSHSKAFERDMVTLHAEFTNFEEFARAWRRIKSYFQSGGEPDDHEKQQK